MFLWRNKENNSILGQKKMPYLELRTNISTSPFLSKML